jgi:hypothetical protein
MLSPARGFLIEKPTVRRSAYSQPLRQGGACCLSLLDECLELSLQGVFLAEMGSVNQSSGTPSTAGLCTPTCQRKCFRGLDR